MASHKETAERATARRYVEAVRQGDWDAAINLVGAKGSRQAAPNERLARFCVKAGREALVVLQEWYGPEGIDTEAVLVVMGKMWSKDDKDPAKRSAAVAVESLAGLQAGADREVEACRLAGGKGKGNRTGR